MPPGQPAPSALVCHTSEPSKLVNMQAMLKLSIARCSSCNVLACMPHRPRLQRAHVMLYCSKASVLVSRHMLLYGCKYTRLVVSAQLRSHGLVTCPDVTVPFPIRHCCLKHTQLSSTLSVWVSNIIALLGEIPSHQDMSPTYDQKTYIVHSCVEITNCILTSDRTSPI